MYTKSPSIAFLALKPQKHVMRQFDMVVARWDILAVKNDDVIICLN